ncbi:MAG: 5'-nucleotidase C-terminal domain-containing protein [Cyclobacteriaceae bacterium]|nr:5'-nucleotidase C-terminal domain-containing protein [Cyclobacteriaceae bacterium]MCH8517261.1 5'-nucleotidase C-terminal domain-containing protein [Cyclobacteriaceae bacterium]
MKKKKGIFAMPHFIFIFIFFFIGGCGSNQSLDEQTLTFSTSSYNIDSLLVQDTDVENWLSPYRDTLRNEMNQVIATSSQELYRDSKECNLGNWVSDLIRSQTQSMANQTVDIGMISMGGLRASIPKGEVTIGNAFELMPFENEVLILALRPRHLEDLFQYIYTGKNIALSGVKIQFDAEGKYEVKINNEPWDPDRIYYMATTDYLAHGGDRLFFLRDADRIEVFNERLRELIIKEMVELTEEGRSIIAQKEGRITWE